MVPLSKERMRERKKQDRLVKPISLMSNPVKPKTKAERLELAHLALVNAVKPKTDALRDDSSPLKEESNSKAPLYNPKTSQPGDLVRKWVGGRWVIVEAKLVDADGNEVPEYW